MNKKSRGGCSRERFVNFSGFIRSVDVQRYREKTNIFKDLTITQNLITGVCVIICVFKKKQDLTLYVPRCGFTIDVAYISVVKFNNLDMYRIYRNNVVTRRKLTRLCRDEIKS